MPEDKIKDGEEKLLYQLRFPRNIDERIDGKKRYFANVDYLNTKQEFKHRYITSVPAEATYYGFNVNFSLSIKGRLNVTARESFVFQKQRKKAH